MNPLVETIPDDLFAQWSKGPLKLATRASLPIVELSGRTLTLKWGHDILRADVQDCHFRIGRPWQMKHNSRSARPLLPFGNHDLILIDFPPLNRGLLTGKPRSLNTAPVGYTQESLKAWKAALADLLRSSNADSVKRSVMRFLES